MYDLPRIKKVTPAKQRWALKVTWADDTADTVNMTGLVHRSRHFRAFLDDRGAFKKVRVAEYGGGIEWPNGLDYAATTLKTMANEQKKLKGSYLGKFAKAFRLNDAEVAHLLNVSRRTLRDYKRLDQLPEPVAVALRAMEMNSAILDAHYRPMAVRPRGRPKKAAT